MGSDIGLIYLYIYNIFRNKALYIYRSGCGDNCESIGYGCLNM